MPLAWSCSSDSDDNNSSSSQQGKAEKPHWTAQSAFPATQEPNWTPVEETNPTESMTCTAKLDGNFGTLSTDDRLAAFCNGKCIGVTPAIHISNNEYLFFLYIQRPEGEGKNISIAYYNSKTKNCYYWPDRFKFMSDQILGTPSSPYLLPKAEENNGYECKTIVSFNLPKDLVETFDEANDEIALFVGDECRALFKVDGIDYKNKYIFAICTFPFHAGEEMFYVRYYSSKLKKIFRSQPYEWLTFEPSIIPLTEEK